MSEPEYGIEMTETEITTFLNRQGHGVLSLGAQVRIAVS